MIFHDRLDYLCTSNRISKAEVAKKIGVSKNTLSNWKKSNTIPTGDILIKLADIFGVSVDYLLGHETSAVQTVDGVTPEELEKALALIKALK